MPSLVKGIGLLMLVPLGALVCCMPQPLPRRIRPVFHESPELIPYRALERDDFKGSRVTGFSRAEENQLQAMTCTQIIVRPRNVVTRGIRSANGAMQYVSSLDDPLFFAAMNRTCSWWRPDGVLSEARVLEHEQIHFAIEELEARRLNSRAGDIAQRIQTRGNDLGEVSQRAQSELRSVLDSAQDASMQRSTLFDIQARDPVVQRRWFQKVSAELEATRAYARGPQTSFDAESSSVPPATETAPIPPPSPAHAPSSPAAPPAPAPPSSSSPKQHPPTPTPTSPGSSASFPE
jgi:hypothetical protein